MASAAIFGTVNQKSPASPCWYAKSVDTKTAGAQIHEAAMLEPPKNQPTFRSPTRKFSTEVRFCHHAKRYVAPSMTKPNARRSRYVAPVESVTSEFTRTLYRQTFGQAIPKRHLFHVLWPHKHIELTIECRYNQNRVLPIHLLRFWGGLP